MKLEGLIEAGRESAAEGRLTGISAIDAVVTPIRHRALLAALVRRDLDLRFKGSALGLAWLVLAPLALVAVYTYAFGFVFKARFDETGGLAHSALSIYLGTILFQSFADPLGRAASVVHDQRVFVKKVAIPLRILPLVPVATAAICASVSLAVFLAARIALFGLPGPGALLAVPSLAALWVFVAGACMAVACVGAYVRDLRHVVPSVMTAVFFVTPVFYPMAAAPDWARPILSASPLAFWIDAVRAALVGGDLPAPGAAAAHAAIALAVAAGGYAAYRRSQGGFADVV